MAHNGLWGVGDLGLPASRKEAGVSIWHCMRSCTAMHTCAEEPDATLLCAYPRPLQGLTGIFGALQDLSFYIALVLPGRPCAIMFTLSREMVQGVAGGPAPESAASAGPAAGASAGASPGAAAVAAAGEGDGAGAGAGPGAGVGPGADGAAGSEQLRPPPAYREHVVGWRGAWGWGTPCRPWCRALAAW